MHRPPTTVDRPWAIPNVGTELPLINPMVAVAMVAVPTLVPLIANPETLSWSESFFVVVDVVMMMMMMIFYCDHW